MPDSSAATVIEGLLKRLYELDADDHPAEEAARAYLAQQKELPTPEEVRGILPKPPPAQRMARMTSAASPRWRWPISVMVQRDLSRVIVVWRGWRW